MTSRRIAPVLALVAASTLVLTACASTAPTADDGRITIVATTNVYGQIAEEVGGEAVAVTSLVSSTSQDPHDFEASAGDQLKVKRADLLIENGGGFDPFLDALAEASGSTATIISAAELSPLWPADGDLEGFNEHVFYDPATMGLLAARIADELGTLDPARAADFAANAASFAEGTAQLGTDLADIAAAHTGAMVFVTEPLPLYLTGSAGLENATPPEFSEAVEEGQDVPPATLLESLDIIASGDITLVITNAQAAGAETTQIEEAAAAAGVPVLKFSEILPEATTYLEWMHENIDQLAEALGE